MQYYAGSPEEFLASVFAHLTCVWRIFLCLRLLAGDGLHFLCGRAGRHGIAALAPTHITLLDDIVATQINNALDCLSKVPLPKSQTLCYRLWFRYELTAKTQVLYSTRRISISKQARLEWGTSSNRS